MTWAYTADEQSCTGGGGVRDEEAVSSDPPHHWLGRVHSHWFADNHYRKRGMAAGALVVSLAWATLATETGRSIC